MISFPTTSGLQLKGKSQMKIYVSVGSWCSGLWDLTRFQIYIVYWIVRTSGICEGQNPSSIYLSGVRLGVRLRILLVLGDSLTDYGYGPTLTPINLNNIKFKSTIYLFSITYNDNKLCKYSNI